MLVATQNPCPCGYLGDPAHECSCSSSQILNYQKKISGPLLDRIDLVVSVGRISHEELLGKTTVSPDNSRLRNAIARARLVQAKRYQTKAAHNASLNSSQIKNYLPLSSDVKQLLSAAAKRLDLSTRSYFKVIKVARSIADLENQPEITVGNISEALQYRTPT
jgi:magnesium chelatase family protein